MKISMRSFTSLLCFSFLITYSHAQTDSASYYISFDGKKIYYETKGEGFPVLLLHGFTGNGQSWKRGMLYNDLIAAGYKVIIPDLRGNGKSDKPTDDSSYANDAEAKDMIGLMSSLEINKYNVIGYSRGSIITARLLVLDTRINKGVMEIGRAHV